VAVSPVESFGDAEFSGVVPSGLKDTAKIKPKLQADYNSWLTIAPVADAA
jgi:hypothetical protein